MHDDMRLPWFCSFMQWRCATRKQVTLPIASCDSFEPYWASIIAVICLCVAFGVTRISFCRTPRRIGVIITITFFVPSNLPTLYHTANYTVKVLCYQEHYRTIFESLHLTLKGYCKLRGITTLFECTTAKLAQRNYVYVVSRFAQRLPPQEHQRIRLIYVLLQLAVVPVGKITSPSRTVHPAIAMRPNSSPVSSPKGDSILHWRAS